MPRGGARIGAGRKPKDRATAQLHGSRERTVVRFPAPAQPPGEALAPEPVEPPAGLPAKVLGIWRQYASHATANGTLVPATAAAFAFGCRAVLLERRLSKGPSAGGSNHRGMMVRVEVFYRSFGLAPIGKPIAAPTKAADDPFAEFDSAVKGAS